MQVDLDAKPEQFRFESTICIIGAGIAGLMLARDLARRGIDVHLLEAGGRTLESRSQEMYAVEMEGRPHDGATAGRFRVFGGSSTRWGGQLLSYPSDIFRPPAGVPSLGWPLSSADLEPYYAEIHDVMHVTRRSSETDVGELPRGDADINIRFSKWAPFSARNLANTIGNECLTSDRITVFLHTNVTCLEASKTTGSIERVIAKDYSQKTYEFRAKYFVVCTGTIESCRLLLASSTALECLSNGADNVGRYFHDHVSVAAATVTGSARLAFTKLFAPIMIDGTLHTPKLEASGALRSKHQLPAIMAHFAIDEPEGSPTAAIRNFLQSMQRGCSTKVLLKDMLALPRNSLEIARLLWFAQVRKRRVISKDAIVTLRLDTEQLPRADSRIRLSAKPDRLGIPRTVIDWQISKAEHRAVQLYAKCVDRFLGQLGIHPLSWCPELEESGDSWLKLTHDTYHPMGGTRMGTSPRNSVVNPDLQVHGISNLFVASCSVFPSGGSSNPTFTLMALTLRLGKQLHRLCRARVELPVPAHQEAVAL